MCETDDRLTLLMFFGLRCRERPGDSVVDLYTGLNPTPDRLCQEPGIETGRIKVENMAKALLVLFCL